jgi:hypothetical protein
VPGQRGPAEADGSVPLKGCAHLGLALETAAWPAGFDDVEPEAYGVAYGTYYGATSSSWCGTYFRFPAL